MTQIFQFDYEIIAANELPPSTIVLMNSTIAALKQSYSPYSKFKVACSLLLDDGAIISASNIENAAFPACLCAERVALSTALTQHPQTRISQMFLITNPRTEQEFPAPCGECRQVLFEVAQKNKTPISIYMYKSPKEVLFIDDVRKLLPFGFSGAQFSK